MVGLPGETLALHQETIRLNQQIQPDVVGSTIFYPMPGTDLYDLCLKEGYIQEEGSALGESDTIFKKSILRMPQFTPEEIEKALRWFTFKVFWPYDKVKALGYRVLVFFPGGSPARPAGTGPEAFRKTIKRTVDCSPMDEKRRAALDEFRVKSVFDSQEGLLRKYKSLMVGDQGWWALIKFELITTLFGWVPGALGLSLRALFYPSLFKETGKKVSSDET